MKVLVLTCLFVSSLCLAQDSELSCKKAYEKARWKTQHKKLGHKTLTLWRARKEDEFGKGTSRKDVQAAIDYGFKSGIYCQDNKILSQKEFQIQTVENMKAIQAAKVNNGMDLISTVETEAKVSCRDLVKMSRTTKKDGYSRRAFLLAGDLHNIEKAYSDSSPEDQKGSKSMKRAKKMKDRFLRSIRNKAVRKHDDDSISMADVEKVFNDSIDDGTACKGRKVMNRPQMRKELLKRLADKENRSEAVNSNISDLKNNINVIFKQNDVEQGVDIEGIQAQDA